MMVGDNIYHFDAPTKKWCQADSHHSNVDGSPNQHNLRVDTQTDRVLLSKHFFYFGAAAPEVPAQLLENIGYTNGRNYRVFDEGCCTALIHWLHAEFPKSLNCIHADPFDFESSEKRYSAHDNKVT